MTVPVQPKVYHIVHVNRLQSIIADGCLWCDAELARRTSSGTVIGMNKIKSRRLHDLTLTSYPQLQVGDCVPFYFCPRSVMLYMIYRGNDSELTYRGGQGPIIHFEADLRASVTWAQKLQKKWAFTLSNAGSYFFEDRCRLEQLNEINWDAVQADRWSGNGVESSVKEGKQAEFLMEYSFPWQLVERIGVYSRPVYQQTVNVLPNKGHRPRIELRPEWYY
ncbi:MAG: DUF4433 domain-containing protein [Candidatus Electrothrix sp. AR5]|nr:DUF4433 domain-containing protein [Candidatus Electrothrix sp. AR5]